LLNTLTYLAGSTAPQVVRNAQKAVPDYVPPVADGVTMRYDGNAAMPSGTSWNGIAYTGQYNGRGRYSYASTGMTVQAPGIYSVSVYCCFVVNGSGSRGVRFVAPGVIPGMTQTMRATDSAYQAELSVSGHVYLTPGVLAGMQVVQSSGPNLALKTAQCSLYRISD
jgi:hypothetical protein